MPNNPLNWPLLATNNGYATVHAMLSSLKQLGWTDERIADKLLVAPSAVTKKRTELHIPSSLRRCNSEALADLLASDAQLVDCTRRQLATKLGISVKATDAWLKKLNKKCQPDQHGGSRK